MEKYLTSEQVAGLLQVHPFTILKYLRSGTLEGVKIGRVYRIKESDVEKFLNHSTVKSETRIAKPIKEKPIEKPEPEQATHELHFQDDIAAETPEYYKVL